jgi:hypothetical protein
MIAVLETGDTVYVISQKKIPPHPVNIISLVWEIEKKGLKCSQFSGSLVLLQNVASHYVNVT